MRKILYITTSNLTTNPRLYKEINVASQHYSTTVLCFSLGNWSDAIDAQLLETIPNTEVQYIAAHRTPLLPWLLIALSHKAAATLWPFFEDNMFLSAAASNKRSLQLYSRLSFHKEQYADYDLIVAHNLGALYPAHQLSEQLNIPFTFDVEDYHPGESIGGQDAKHEKERRERLMQLLLPAAKLVTAASPLIKAEVEKLANVEASYISNSFYSSEFKFKEVSEQTEVKFVWFSQNINYGRGLELFITLLDNVVSSCSLTLIGNLQHDFAKEWITSRPYIKVLEPLEQVKLHAVLANYDIGLALELSNADFNRQLALTNKLFAYLQAGLFVVATDTEAQKQLLIEEYPNHGIVGEQSEAGITKSINFVLNNIAQIRKEKKRRFQNSKSLAFELEGQKLLTLWSGLFSKENNEESNHRISTFPPL